MEQTPKQSEFPMLDIVVTQKCAVCGVERRQNQMNFLGGKALSAEDAARIEVKYLGKYVCSWECTQGTFKPLGEQKISGAEKLALIKKQTHGR